MNKFKSKITFFFALFVSVLLSACGIKNTSVFVGEDAKFANYVEIGTNSSGLAFYEDENNPGTVAVAAGTCTATNIVVSSFNGKAVTEVMPSGFKNCLTLSTISLPNTITTFGTEAFAGSGLTSITIPNNVEVISTGCFRNCRDLLSVNFNEGNLVKRINSYAFANDSKITDFSFNSMTNLIFIGEEAFLYCLGLRSVILPNGFLTLSAFAFHDCRGLTTIFFPASITTISEYAFRGVGGNATIYFNESKEQALGDCGISYDPTEDEFRNLINYKYNGSYIPTVFGVGNIMVSGNFRFIRPESGFYDMMLCESPTGTDADFQVSTTEIQRREFLADDEAILFGYNDRDVTTLDIPSTFNWGIDFKVVGIANSLFKDYTKLTSVTFNENLRFIDYQAFSGCTALTTIHLETASDLKYIQPRAFFNCMPYPGSSSKLKATRFPSSLESIELDAFRNATTDGGGLFRLYFDGASDEITEEISIPSTIKAGKSLETYLAYEPTNILSFNFSSYLPSQYSYTITETKLVIKNNSGADIPSKSMVFIKYQTNNTTTRNFVGNGSNTTFSLSSEAEAIGLVRINGATTTNYTFDEVDDVTRIIFNSAPAAGSKISVSYRTASHLRYLGVTAFKGANNNKSSFQTYNSAYHTIVFPETLECIDQGCFKDCQIVGGAIFQSDVLVIKTQAFFSQECFSTLEFKEDMTSLTIYGQAFANEGVDYFHQQNWNPKLNKVILPEHTTIMGDFIFQYHYHLSIYCVNSLPNNISVYPYWNLVSKTDQNYALRKFSDYSSSYLLTEFNTHVTYVIGSSDDVISVPSNDYPIFDFVKSNDGASAILSRFRSRSGFSTDENGMTAIASKYPGETSYSNSNKSIYVNPNFNSNYLKIEPNTLHYQVIIPSSVSFDEGTSFLTVKEIGDFAFLGLVYNASNKPNSSNTNYWTDSANPWAVSEVTMPNSIERIGDYAFGTCPIKSIYCYNNQDSVLTSGVATVSNGNNIGQNYHFPSSLKDIGMGAFSFTRLTKAYIPATLERMGGVEASSTPTYSTFNYNMYPFQGSFDLNEIVFENTQPGQNPIFSESNGAIVFTNPTTSNTFVMGGVPGADTIVIPWGTTDNIAIGAFRGSRKAESLIFPYTLTRIPEYFIDSIGGAYDSSGTVGTNNLRNVQFHNALEYGVAVTTQNSKCKYIDRSAFAYSKNLESFEFPKAVETLGYKAFEQCISLNNFYVDNGQNGAQVSLGSHLNFAETNIKTLNNSIFSGCVGITQVTSSTNIKSFGNNVFENCTGLQTVTTSTLTKTIGSSCFFGCTSLTSFTSLSTDATTLSSKSFYNDYNLTEINLVDVKTSIGENAFYGCSSLTSFNIPINSSVSKKAFELCTGLNTTISNNIVTSGGVVVGKNVTFSGAKTDSAFKSCNSNLCIFLKDTDSEYYRASPNGGDKIRYPLGWNYINENTGLNVYCQAPTDGDITQGLANYGHWRYNGNGQIVILNDPN